MGIEFRLGRNDHKVIEDFVAGTVALTDRVRVVACPGDSSSSLSPL
jgi:hypothetical protein